MASPRTVRRRVAYKNNAVVSKVSALTCRGVTPVTTRASRVMRNRPHEHSVLRVTGRPGARCVPREPGRAPRPAGTPGVHVQGNQLVDSSGRPVRVRGSTAPERSTPARRGGASSMARRIPPPCRRSRPRNANVVRRAAQMRPAARHQRRRRGVRRRQLPPGDYRLRRAPQRAGLVVILDLHWSAAGTAIALGQAADAATATIRPEFWRQLATTFKGNDRVMFDLFNEPFPDNNSDTPEAWRCCATAEPAAG